MFYSDSTMHKIYIDEGSFDFTYQLPQMFYSLVITSVLKFIINIFGLYEKDILEFKKSKDKKNEDYIFKIKCKIIFFFIFTFIFLFFFWIYLGCFSLYIKIRNFIYF